MVTAKRDNCPAERERAVEQTRKGSRLRVVKESPRQGYCQDDLVSEGLSLILALNVIRKRGVEIAGCARGPGLTAASGGRTDFAPFLPSSPGTLSPDSYFSTPVASREKKRVKC